MDSGCSGLRVEFIVPNNYSVQSLRLLTKKKFMQTNLWNIKSSKQRLGIRERTEAHKRHLISLIKTKPTVDIANKQCKIKSLNANFNKRKCESIERDNLGLLQRISSAGKSHRARIQTGSSCKFTKITENLKTICAITRYNRNRAIQQENNKIFDRLVQTPSTLSRRLWVAENKQNQKYKLNLSRTKYSTPDYSEEVNKMLHDKKMTFKHLKLSRCEAADPSKDVSLIRSVRA